MSTLAIVAIAVAAAVLGALAGMAYQTSRQQRARAARRASAPPASAAPPDQQSQQLRLENQRLRQQLATLRRELDELHHLSRPPAATPPAPSGPKKRKPRPATAPAPAELIAPPAEAAEAAAPAEATPPAEPAAPAVLYASAVPGGYLADAQLAAQAMGRMPLAVCPDPTEPTRATFTLSPEVDKSWLIEAGLDRLRDYFDYEPPTGWPSTVAATAAGQLRREGEGWRVAPGGKGRLDVR